MSCLTPGFARHLAVWFLVGTFLGAQCPPHVPTEEPIQGAAEELAIEAILLLDCCGACSGSPEIIDAAEGLLEKSEGGDIRGRDGDESWLAYTAANTSCGTHEHWTTDGGNSIVLNTSLVPASLSIDPLAAAAMLAGALLHEYAHCITFANTWDTVAEQWDDRCGWYHNEVFCYLVEDLALSCILACGCVDPAALTSQGGSYLEGRASQIQRYRQHSVDAIAEDC